MVARARRDGESFEEYRTVLRQEEEDLKLYLQGISPDPLPTTLEVLQEWQKKVLELSVENQQLKEHQTYLNHELNELKETVHDLSKVTDAG